MKEREVSHEEWKSLRLDRNAVEVDYKMQVSDLAEKLTPILDKFGLVLECLYVDCSDSVFYRVCQKG